MYIAQFTILAILVVAGCVMTEIIYVSSPMSSMFWLSLGRLVKQASEPVEEGESQHAESFERIGSRV